MKDGDITFDNYIKPLLDELYRNWPECEEAMKVIIRRTKARRRFTPEEHKVIKIALDRFSGVEVRQTRAQQLCQGCWCLMALSGEKVPDELGESYHEVSEIALGVWSQTEKANNN